MGYFVVIREAGPGWIDPNGAFEQAGVNDHAAFMNELSNEGVVLFAGPLDGTEAGRIRVLLVVDAENEAAVHERLAADPWTQGRQLVVTSIEPWTLFVGGDRLVGETS